MSKVLITEGYLENIAGSIRRKKNTGETYKVSEMSAAIDSIPTADTTTKNITANGTYNAYNADGVAGYSQVTVAVPTPTMAPKTITANGTYSPQADNVSGYNSVLVNVQKEITSADNGKVVVNGFLTAQTSRDVAENGIYNTTTNDSVRVNVPNTYSASDEGKVVSSGALVSQTTRNVDANGTYNTATNNEVVVDVPNSYDATDEGKVVSDGALASQTSRSVTENGTYDTTTNNSVSVDVPLSATLITKSITANGTYSAASDNADGYSSVTVDVEESGLAAILGNFATVEETTTASKAYAVGDYLVYDEKFYVVTAPIAQGGTITPGTNCTQTNVGAEVTTLNNSLTDLGTYTKTTGTYTTASWATGTNTAVWTAPADGVYLLYMRYELADNSSTNRNSYKQLFMSGTATRLCDSILYYDASNSSDSSFTVRTITQPVIASEGQTIIPYVHTGTANIVYNIVILGLRLK